MCSMQLDLFTDNRRTILLNDADQLLQALRLEEALAVYAELLAEYPKDAELSNIRNQVAAWRDRLAAFLAAPAGRDRLYDLWQTPSPSTPTALAAAVRGLLINELLPIRLCLADQSVLPYCRFGG